MKLLLVLLAVKQELIDTLWNVNLAGGCEYTVMVVELIDTLWNVNSFDTVSATGTTLELIDTLWNVNLLQYPRASKHTEN